MGQKQNQCTGDVGNFFPWKWKKKRINLFFRETNLSNLLERCNQEIERLKSKIHDLEAEESDLKRRLLGAERYKETLKDLKVKETKLGFTLEKLTDKLEFYKDDLDQCKIDLIAANQWTDDHSYKDTHLDLGMEMWITHNKSKVEYSTMKYTMATEGYVPKVRLLKI